MIDSKKYSIISDHINFYIEPLILLALLLWWPQLNDGELKKGVWFSKVFFKILLKIAVVLKVILFS